MDELRSFIKDNRELFEKEALPQGHQTRFEKRLAKSGLKKNRIRVKYLVYTSVAALLLVVLSIGIRFIKEDPLAGLFADPCVGEASGCYYNQIRKISSQIEYDSRNLPEFKRQEILMNMQSLIPDSSHEFSDMLPREISDKEAERLNKEYYKQLYQGMIQIASLTK
ncbi:MAG: hypothetical protein PHT64_06970 [Bacteroidales bacterium]|nr:hypothetical protein [Bacteroidales bacterium]MDD3522106.1 hypothetical protein [Bacteroidales bacterium]MDD4030147.1 hypothetical protein [Bacteroidales bacterium]MDD4435514.1 hypothetical protein [Bacteroidales bacterium]MDD5733519.1 hypothetical protein [Bacteroidales bacterium]